MSSTPTADQIADLRTDIGDTDASPMFSDPEIIRFWFRVRGATDENSQHEATLALMARSMLTNAARMHDYKAGNSEEKMSQVFANLRAIYALYKKALDSALGQSSSVAMGYLTGVNDGSLPNEGDTASYAELPPLSAGEF